MAVKTEERRIGDHTYRVTQLTALKARALFARLVRFIGPAAATAIGAGQLPSMGDLGGMLGELTERVSDDELGWFAARLGECSYLVGDNGKVLQLEPSVVDLHFAGALLDMFKWMAFALEVNFADFLSVLKRTQAAASTAPANQASRSPLDSTGTSTGS